MIIRAILDAFWSRATKTISNHVQEVRNMARYGQMLHYPPMPVLGPWPLHAHLGMDAAVMVLLRSMEKGKTGLTVKYGTARKARATLIVLWESSSLWGEDLLLAGSVKDCFVATLCTSEGQWYQHFESGKCMQMGDIVSQDRAYTIEVLLALLDMFEEVWQTFYLWIPLASISACMFLLVSCLGGMRDFKVVWSDLAALWYDIAYCEESENNTAVSWPVIGRFKARHGILDCYMIPIARVTCFGIRFFTWTQRFVQRLAEEGFEVG
jgi:hypothetical protein